MPASIFSPRFPFFRRPAPPAPLPPLPYPDALEITRPAAAQPGELWLRAGDEWRRAVGRTREDNNTLTDNKLVLGPAGSGRSVLLARLARAAHAGGNQVVIVNNCGTNLNNCGALWYLTQGLGGLFTQLDAPAKLCFNPFWFPAEKAGEQLPTSEQVGRLVELLDALFHLTSRAQSPRPAPLDPAARRGGLFRALRAYYAGQQWRPAAEYPAFDSFYELLRRQDEAIPDQVGRWLLQAGEPFYRGGALDQLLNETPGALERHLSSLGSLLHVDMPIGAAHATSVDTPALAAGPGSHPAPEALQRAWLLLLHSVDGHLGRRARRLTIVVDEWHYAALGPRVADYLETYLREGRTHNREIVVGWHERPARVFAEEHPAARVLLRESGLQLLLARRLHYPAVDDAPLNLTAAERQALEQLQPDAYEVLLRRGAGKFQVFSAKLCPTEVRDYRRPRLTGGQ